MKRDPQFKAAVSFLRAKRLKSVVEEAYAQLKKEGAELGCEHIPDRFGSYADYYVKWNKKKVIAILEEMIRVK